MKMIESLDEFNEFLESSIRTTSVEIETKYPFSKRIEILGEKKIKKVMVVIDMDRRMVYIFDGSLLKDWYPQIKQKYKEYLIEYVKDSIENLEFHPERFWINLNDLDDIGILSYSNFKLWVEFCISIQYSI